MIEEPENFLHPEMQKFLVATIRDTLPEDSGYAILSTHSETLLNKCQAKEILVVDFKRGATKALRIKDPQSLEDAINETGFGLGNYYVSGVVDSLNA